LAGKHGAEVDLASSQADATAARHAHGSIVIRVGIAYVAERCDECTGTGAVILWLAKGRVEAISRQLPTGRVYFSSILLGDELNGSLPEIAGDSFVAHSFRLPGKVDPALARFKVWAKTRGVELTSPRRQSEAFFACLAMKDAIAHMGRFFIRDFALDTLDHAQSFEHKGQQAPDGVERPEQNGYVAFRTHA
jgi:hypothetical protein